MIKQELPDSFSGHLKQSLRLSAAVATKARQTSIKPIHLLLALAQTSGALAAELLERTKLNVASLEQYVVSPTTKNRTYVSRRKTIPLSTEAEGLLLTATTIAHRLQHTYVGTEHLLKALVEQPGNEIKTFARQASWPFTNTLQEQLELLLKSGSRLPELTGTFIDENLQDEMADEPNDLPTAVRTFGTHLTHPEHANTLDPVVGREQEIDRLMQILVRRTKNNPVLLGDPGVGKTAIVEGFAKRIAEGNVPPVLKNKKILALDVGSLVAGTMFRGEFENRIRQVIDELKRNPEVIIFIDELHTIVGAGSASGSVDAANLLKPALARGNIRCIGATTLEEYREHIESDGALERRFQPIQVAEPNSEATLAILKSLRPKYESHHAVRISDEAMHAAVSLSERFLPERFLPDKAVDLLDEAAARVAIRTAPTKNALRLDDLKEAQRIATKRKEAATVRERFEEALHWKQEAALHQARILELEHELAQSTERRATVTHSDMIAVLTSWTNVPVADLVKEQEQELRNLDKKIAQYFFGHEPARNLVAQTIQRAQLGLSQKNKPLASFLFVGSSGVGKTTLAKAIAQALFGNEKSLLQFDMSEFSEGFTVSKLIGAPAGYVGYKESGLLTEKIRRQPYQVILFDELNRAHRDVHQLLLQLLAEGRLRDATGRQINFRQTIVVATATTESEAMTPLGFSEKTTTDSEEANHLQQVTRALFPEDLRNRFDAIIPLSHLNATDLEQILAHELRALEKRLQARGKEIIVDSAAKRFLISEAQKVTGGARVLIGQLRDQVENQLATKLLNSRAKKKFRLTIIKNKLWLQ